MLNAITRTHMFSGAGSGATAEAPAEEPAIAADSAPLALELLDGGEVIILALKPSRWFVLFDSLKWVVAGAVLVAGAALAGGGRTGWVSYATLTQATAVLICGRIAAALLRWASRFYVLTNRRVLRIRGVRKPQVLDVPLTDIVNTRISRALHEWTTGLGSIRFACDQAEHDDPTWYHLAHADAIHDQIRRAIERAIDRQHGT